MAEPTIQELLKDAEERIAAIRKLAAECAVPSKPSVRFGDLVRLVRGVVQ